jgi:predicted HNH restriction endonuclease
LHHRFSYDFCPSLGPSFFSDRYLGFYIHILREQSINYFWNKKLPKENSQCAACGLKSDYPYFLEIHDTVKIDFDSEYKPVNIKDFIVLCPSCHKKEHLELRDNSEILLY